MGCAASTGAQSVDETPAAAAPQQPQPPKENEHTTADAAPAKEEEKAPEAEVKAEEPAAPAATEAEKQAEPEAEPKQADAPPAEASTDAPPNEDVKQDAVQPAAETAPVTEEPAAAPEAAPAAVEPAAEPAAAEPTAEPQTEAAPAEAAPAETTPVEATPVEAAPFVTPVDSTESVAVPPVPVEAEAAAPVAAAAEVAAVATAVATKPTTVKPQAIFVLGGPGSGKGTQCANIVKEFGWVHLSAGDLLRDARKNGGEKGELIEEYIVQGRIVPAELTVGLLKSAIESNIAQHRTQFLIDGFPRDVSNLAAWKKVMGSFVELLFVLFFDCSEEIQRKRLLQRGTSSGRIDDNEVAIKKRFETYTKESRPVIERYEKTGRAVRIDAGLEAEAVWEKTRAVFAPIDRDTVPLPKVVDGVIVPRAEPKPLRPQAIFVTGGPGSGKGTQCAHVVKEFGWIHLSAGDLITAERAKGPAASPLAKEIEAHLAAGRVVPAEVVVSLLGAAMSREIARNNTQFLVDGFPRRVSDLTAWKAGTGSTTDLLFVLFFDCSEAVTKQRLLKRGSSKDEEAAIIKRFEAYTKESRPVIEKYEKTGRAVRIDAGVEADVVWQKTRAVFAPIDRDTAPLPKIVVI